MMGEFGTTLQSPVDTVWLQNLLAYTGAGVNGMSFTYWSWNPDSGDTGGIALDDWTTINTAKQAILQPYLIAPVAGPSGGTSGGPTTPVPANGCTESYHQDNAWQGGFQGSLTVKNTGTTAINPWSVTWSWPSGVALSNGWGATVTQSGTTVTAAGPNGSTSLAAGASATIGFTATGTASTPAAVKLASAVCS
jgi:endoglucanase